MLRFLLRRVLLLYRRVHVVDLGIILLILCGQDFLAAVVGARSLSPVGLLVALLLVLLLAIGGIVEIDSLHLVGVLPELLVVLDACLLLNDPLPACVDHL